MKIFSSVIYPVLKKYTYRKNFCIIDYPNKDAEIELLNTIIEPKDKVVALWRDTYEQRRLALRSSSVTVQELFDRYAALSTSMGPELVRPFFVYVSKIPQASAPVLSF